MKAQLVSPRPPPRLHSRGVMRERPDCVAPCVCLERAPCHLAWEVLDRLIRVAARLVSSSTGHSPRPTRLRMVLRAAAAAILDAAGWLELTSDRYSSRPAPSPPRWGSRRAPCHRPSPLNVALAGE